VAYTDTSHWSIFWEIDRSLMWISDRFTELSGLSAVTESKLEALYDSISVIFSPLHFSESQVLKLAGRETFVQFSRFRADKSWFIKKIFSWSNKRSSKAESLFVLRCLIWMLEGTMLWPEDR
jgi:hypothetical protein